MKNLTVNKLLTGLSFVKKSFIAFCVMGITICISSSCNLLTPNPDDKKEVLSPIDLKVQLVADSLHSPTAIAFPDSANIWITEQTGTLRVVKNGKLAEAPLLDLRSKMIDVNNNYEERGVLGIALHPQFTSNKKFYLFYSAPSTQKMNHKDVVAEFILPVTGGPIDPNSGRTILEIEKPDGNHNGGCIQFGNDGYLYISLGDGGGQHDNHGTIGNGQNLETWLGKILRVDINTDSGYGIPKDNPFVGRNNVKPEIFAYGFRNPYRFSFDKASGQLFAGEVGQDNWEEIDIVKSGANYGWRIAEGTHCHNPETDCDTTGITMPITEYSHRTGISVTGGYVYNGNQLPGLKSKYIFADWTGPTFYLQKTDDEWQRGKVVLQNIAHGTKIIGFGEDSTGELYVLGNLDTGPENKNGSVYKIVKN